MLIKKENLSKCDLTKNEVTTLEKRSYSKVIFRLCVCVVWVYLYEYIFYLIKNANNFYDHNNE